MNYSDYTVGWICALPLELAASLVMLDEKHESLPRRVQSDHNMYNLGRIGEHNVVMACLPPGQIGVQNVAIATAQMLNTFPNIRFCLMVGIGGGVPGKKDIRLGDVVVSKPSGQFGGVVQYDFGRSVSQGAFERTGSLNAPPRALLNGLGILMAWDELGHNDFAEILSSTLSEKLSSKFSHPGADQDHLYEAEYEHQGGPTCATCDPHKRVPRKARDNTDPRVHYGSIGSANRVIKDAMIRDELKRDYNIICVEMEAAGLMNDFSCLVIRGISDYADSHKNKIWLRYAATAAAAYAKQLLRIIPQAHVTETPPIPPSLPVTHQSRELEHISAASSVEQIATDVRRTEPVGIANDTVSSSSRQSANTATKQRSSFAGPLSFMTQSCLGPTEAALGRLVLNLKAPSDDYCPHAPIKILRKDVSVVPFHGLASFITKRSRLAGLITKVIPMKTGDNYTIPEYVLKSANTSRLLNSGSFLERLLQDTDTRRWLEGKYRKRDVYLTVGIHSFSDAPPDSTAPLDPTTPDSQFCPPGNWIIGVRYRRIRLSGVSSPERSAASLHCGIWKRYVNDSDGRDDGDQYEYLAAGFGDDLDLGDLSREYDVDIDQSEPEEVFLFPKTVSC